MTHMQPRELTARMSDGQDLFYRAWLPTARPDTAVVLFHRGNEHSGRLVDVVDELALSNTAVFAWDARGHGRSPGRRGWAPDFSRLVQDVEDFIRHLLRRHNFKSEDVVVIAHSDGAVVASTWVHDYAPRVRALVLVAPALRVKPYAPFATVALWLLLWLRGGEAAFVRSYVKSKKLTHDKRQAWAYDQDSLVIRDIAVNVLLGMRRAAKRISADAAAIRVPTLIVSGRADKVVRLRDQRRFFERLGSAHKKMRIFSGLYHDVLHERGRSSVLDEIRQYVNSEHVELESTATLLRSHVGGFTYEEYRRLRQPLVPLSPRRLHFGACRVGIRTVGRLSQGIRTGLEHGFDSGKMLDYVYENQARGRLGIGRLIDRGYLDSPGWRGIRSRKDHLRSQILRAARRVSNNGAPIRLLDIAGGCGRYVLEALTELDDIELSALLLDYKEENLTAGRRLAADMGIDRATFERGDAFDCASIGALRPQADVAIVSGLYELFPDNQLVLRSLSGLAAAVRPGGYLVYTGQPWHPQLELIARVLTNRDGKPWIMRRRTQPEMDALVAAVGFRKLETEIDTDGIFTVSTAIKDS